MSDDINHPDHYMLGPMECKDVLKIVADSLNPEAELWPRHCLLKALEYYMRAGRKGDPQKDWEKADKWLKFMYELEVPR